MNISPITLGTAQLTTPYGIANTSSGFSKGSAFSLLENAIKNGITTLDTSPAYGKSEQVIGQYLKKNDSSVTICTKLPSIIKKYGNKVEPNKIYDIVTKSIELSLNALNRNVIDYYLIHDENDFIIHGKKLIYALTKNIEAGKILAIGISVYTPVIADLALQEKKIKLIQLPMNIFDHRFKNHIKKAVIGNVRIIVRSVYLQGLFFISLDLCKQKIPQAYNPLKKLLQMAHHYNLSIPEIAVGYIKSIDEISSIVLGMENLQQLNENTALLNMANLSEELIFELDNIFKYIPIDVIDPTKWQN